MTQWIGTKAVEFNKHEWADKAEIYADKARILDYDK